MSQQLLRRAWNFIDTIKQVYPEHWSPEEQILLDDLMKADLDLSGVKREWVGLTDGDVFQIAEQCGLASVDWIDVMRAVEAKLKEKNT